MRKISAIAMWTTFAFALSIPPAGLGSSAFGASNDVRVPQPERERMVVRPLNDRVLVKPENKKSKSAGGIYIPDTAAEKPQEGKIIAVGKSKVDEDGAVQAPSVKSGDDVLFGTYGGTEVKIDGEEHEILREDDLLGIIE